MSNPHGPISTHFGWTDLLCRCGCIAPPEILEGLKRLAPALEAIRARAGTPLLVTSGYRCPARNAKIGGAPESEHLRGIAADLHPLRCTPEQLAQVIEAMQDDGSLPPGGLGRYPGKTIVHVDIRGVRARWTHGSKP